VVDLEHLASRDLDLESFVTAGLLGVVHHCGVEGHLGSVGAVDNVLVQRLVVWHLASTAGEHNEHDEQEREGDPKSAHVASACSRVNLPSYSALPMITA